MKSETTSVVQQFKDHLVSKEIEFDLLTNGGVRFVHQDHDVEVYLSDGVITFAYCEHPAEFGEWEFATADDFEELVGYLDDPDRLWGW